MVVDAGTVSAIDTCVESLGPEGAFRGVLFAFDNGYDAEQVTAAMSDGSLDANGVIRGVEPSGAMVGLIDRSGPSAHAGVILAAGPVIVAAGPVTAEEFKRGVGDEIAAMFPDFNFITVAETDPQEFSSEASRAMIGTMISLVSAGYTLEQVVDAVIFGEEAIDVPAPGKRVCLVIMDARHEPILPINDPMDGLCSDFYELMRREQAAAGTTTTMAPVETTVAEVATTGVVSGVVLDIESGNGVAGATVALTPGGSTTATDGDGLFALADLAPGGYVVTVTADGFLDGAADVTVVAGETADTTIGLSIDDQLPWVYQGTGVSLAYEERPIWTGGTPENRELQFDMEITMFPDGTVELVRDMSAVSSTYLYTYVDCTDMTSYRKLYEGPPIQILSGTHEDGEFEIPFGEIIVFTGTYNSREIEGGWGQEGTHDFCDNGNFGAFKREFRFGPDGMERVYDTP